MILWRSDLKILQFSVILMVSEGCEINLLMLFRVPLDNIFTDLQGSGLLPNVGKDRRLYSVIV